MTKPPPTPCQRCKAERDRYRKEAAELRNKLDAIRRALLQKAHIESNYAAAIMAITEIVDGCAPAPVSDSKP